jgi:hypothetical protein
MKKRVRGKTSATKKPAARKPKKAVPPPDNPLLRQGEDAAARGRGLDERQQAQARVRALEQTKEMPATCPESPPGAGRPTPR